MKKLFMILLVLSLTSIVFAKSYRVSKVKGDVYIITEDKELIPVKEGDIIEDEDTLSIGEKSSITFYLEDGTPIIIRANGNYKVEKLVK